MRLLKEGYFNDKDIQSDDLVSDIEQSSNSSLSSDFKMSIVFTFNSTTFKQNQTMFRDIYLRLTRILPYISFIADYNLLEAQAFASDSYNSSDNKQMKLNTSSLADFLISATNMMNANMQEYKLIMNTNIVIDRIVPFKRFCKDLYALWKVGHHLRITEISFYKPNSQDNKGLSSRTDSARCFVTDSEFMDTRNAKNVYNLLYPYNSEDFNKTFPDESLWRKTFSKHQRVPFYNHLMFVASHPDMFKDYTTTVYGYKKSLPSLNSQEHQIFLYIKLNTKRLHKNNSYDMLNFVYENFVKCIKLKDSSYFISGNTPNNHFIVLVQSEDEGVLISGDCYISDTIKLTNYDLKCDVIFCNSDLDWTPYNKPYSISILPKSADIEQSHKRLEFMVNKLK